MDSASMSFGSEQRSEHEVNSMIRKQNARMNRMIVAFMCNRYVSKNHSGISHKFTTKFHNYLFIIANYLNMFFGVGYDVGFLLIFAE